MKFEVHLTRTICEAAEMVVEAESKEAAEALVQEAATQGSAAFVDLHWEFVQTEKAAEVYTTEQVGADRRAAKL